MKKIFPFLHLKKECHIYCGPLMMHLKCICLVFAKLQLTLKQNYMHKFKFVDGKSSAPYVKFIYMKKIYLLLRG